ncbi:signal peptidase [Bacillus fengqiuensis]|nr:signal peptidase [Bacillus fengqiuensis]
MKEQYLPINSIKSLLEKKGWIDIPSSGVSMYPLIKQGDICRFVPLDSKSSLKKGEIILFACEDGRLIGHRYYGSFMEEGVSYYLFKGDTNVRPDPPVEKSRLIGKLAFIKKGKVNIRPDSMISQLWGTVVISLPALPRYCKRYMNFKSRLRI